MGKFGCCACLNVFLQMRENVTGQTQLVSITPICELNVMIYGNILMFSQCRSISPSAFKNKRAFVAADIGEAEEIRIGSAGSIGRHSDARVVSRQAKQRQPDEGMVDQVFDVGDGSADESYLSHSPYVPCRRLTSEHYLEEVFLKEVRLPKAAS